MGLLIRQKLSPRFKKPFFRGYVARNTSPDSVLPQGGLMR
jgi:hypothetical protein